MMINFLEETISLLSDYNKTGDDVRWVGSIDGKFSIAWLRFTQIADFMYDDSYGSQHIASDLVIVGDDWWLERHKYDGSEWWEYKDLPVQSVTPEPFVFLQAEHSGTVEELAANPQKRLVE